MILTTRKKLKGDEANKMESHGKEILKETMKEFKKIFLR